MSLICKECHTIYEHFTADLDKYYCPIKSCEGQLFECDDSIAWHISRINQLLDLNGYSVRTNYCCSSHVGELTAYIGFDHMLTREDYEATYLSSEDVEDVPPTPEEEIKEIFDEIKPLVDRLNTRLYGVTVKSPLYKLTTDYYVDILQGSETTHRLFVQLSGEFIEETPRVQNLLEFEFKNFLLDFIDQLETMLEEVESAPEGECTHGFFED